MHRAVWAYRAVALLSVVLALAFNNLLALPAHAHEDARPQAVTEAVHSTATAGCHAAGTCLMAEVHTMGHLAEPSDTSGDRLQPAEHGVPDDVSSEFDTPPPRA